MVKKLAIIIPGLVLTLGISAGVFAAASASAGQGETINTLDYFLSKHPGQGLTGSHNQNQVVTGNTSYYVKWAADAYEVHTWDDQYIYLNEDHSWKYNQGYAFRPGIWMKREMKVGEPLSQPDNTAYYFSSDTCAAAATTALPYTMTLEKHVKNYDLGGDLGRQDVIVLKYDYSTSVNPGNFERFYYSKEWGWVKWELYSGAKLEQTSLFNKISNNPIQPDKSMSCTRGGATASGPDPLALLPTFKILTGKVARAFGGSAIYYITEQGRRQYVCNPGILAYYGITGSDVQVVLPEDLMQYPALSFVQVRRTGDIYKLEGETKHLVTADAQKTFGVAPGAVPPVDAQDLSCYQDGFSL